MSDRRGKRVRDSIHNSHAEMVVRWKCTAIVNLYFRRSYTKLKYLSSDFVLNVIHSDKERSER